MERPQAHRQAARSWSPYNRLADEWDCHVPGSHSALAQELAAALHLARGEFVLDVGAGTGFATLAALKRVGPSGTVIALDPSLPMLRAARQKGIRFLLGGKAPGLPLADDIFDAVQANLVLSHLRDYRSVLSDVARVLKRRGRFAVSVWAKNDNPYLVLWNATALSFGVGREQLRDLIREEIPWESWFAEPQRLGEALTDAGLAKIEIRARSFEVSTSCGAYLAMKERFAAARALRKALSAARWEEFRAAVAVQFANRFQTPLRYTEIAYIASAAKP